MSKSSLFYFSCLAFFLITVLSYGAEIELTSEEREWLKNNPVITVGESSKIEPVLIKDSDGKFAGLVPDFYKILEKRLGVRFKI